MSVLVNGGECGALIEAIDWSATPLGPFASWPASLRTLTGMMVAARQPMFVTWGPGQVVLYNDAYARLMGAKHPAAMGRPIAEVWSDIWSDLAPIVADAYAGHSIQMDDVAFVMERNGFPEETHFAFSYTPVREEDGTVAGFFCACTETTGRIGAESRLRQSEAEVRGVLDGMGEGFLLLDHDFRVRRINAEGLRLDGRPSEVILGRHLLDVWPDAERMPTWPLYRRAMAERASAELTYRHSSTQRDIWIEVRVYPSGSGLSVFYRDVSGRRAAEEALREREERLRLVMEGARDHVVLTMNPQGIITSWSAGAVEVLGWTAADALGRDGAMIFTAEDRAAGIDAAELAEAVNQGRADSERWHRRADGMPVFLAGSLHRLPPDLQGRSPGFLRIARDETQRRAQAEALTESEARFRNMADHAPVMMWVTIPDGSCIYLNRRWYEFTGQTEAEALGLGWTKATHPDDEGLAADTFLAANAAHEPFRVEYRLRRADGTYRWAIDAATPRFGTEGEFLGYVGSVIDIDERREAEERLRQSEGRFQAIADSIDQMVWSTLPDGHHDYFNQRWYDYTGVPAGSTDGAGWNGIFHPDDRDKAWTVWRHSLETGEPYHIEYRLRHRSGQYRWVLGRAQPVRDTDGRIVRWFGTCTEIQEIVEAREVLARSRAELEREIAERIKERDRIWTLIPDLLMSGTLDGRLLNVNPAWTEVLGYDEATLLATPFWEIIHPDFLPHSAEAVEAMRQGRTVRHQNRVRTASGDYRWFDWVSAPVGEVFYAVARDITDEKAREAALAQTQEALRQSQKMEAVGQLTGGIAHDFNNLLTGISGSLELLQTRMAQGRLTELDRYINAAQGASRRAAALTHRLLAFSRRQTLDPKPTNVNALVAGMEELIRRTVGPAVTIEVVGSAGLWPALVDPNQLENALLNLCINARDAMPDGGRLTIETANKWLDGHAARERNLEPGQYLSLCVSDNGTGMTPEVIARAFDPFFTTKPLGEGTGLGLSMIYGFVRQSGGEVRIYSELGEGTTMCLYLPRHYGEASEVDEAGAFAAAPRAQRGETVLIVDDEPTVRMLVTEVLEELGYTAIEAADGASGLKVLQSDVRIDLLVTDVGLPGGMNGRQMADAARVARPDLKILFITGYAENAVVGNGHLEPGMQVLTKPFVMEALAGRIKDMIASGQG
ncbi:hybrid sensor histidine kinase/response regulator [Methylobacterium sp. Leaf106]|uniref:hybrid sensor histidine kinase/response regulator n=1 Tax=Methylobacterium sp. Leaf106 TaxID=1736255 RepID=UPI0007000567|nr:PAS domain S-box protein [Methylobacterium sp. Leaf106]KQP47023.1 PAS domain S-box protein [Methylobacterium sp. Leaf106]